VNKQFQNLASESVVKNTSGDLVKKVSLPIKGYINHSLIRQEKGVKHAKIYTINLRTKLIFLISIYYQSKR
jgi:hypothetical protein